MNEAAIRAARARKTQIDQSMLIEAVERVQMGPEKKSHKVLEEDRKLVAYHEAGHAIVGHFLPLCDEVHTVTIVPRGGAGGFTLSLPSKELDNMSRTHAHQGVIALAAAHVYYSIDDILEEAASRGEAPLIVICDELSDPHNLGAILRSAECAGAHGVIIPKRRSVGLTATVAKASAGAVDYMRVARVTNISAAIAELKQKGVWVFGTAAEGSIPMYQADLSGPAAIVIGSEGDGMSQLVRKNCDVMVNIPMKGRISSLNASAAASILLYEALRQRLG